MASLVLIALFLSFLFVSCSCQTQEIAEQTYNKYEDPIYEVATVISCVGIVAPTGGDRVILASGSVSTRTIFMLRLININKSI